MMGPALSPRRGLFHRALHPLHQIRRHPRAPGQVYCRTCYILRNARARARARRRVT